MERTCEPGQQPLQPPPSGRQPAGPAIGAEGLQYSHGDNILIADNANEFVQNIVSISEGQRKKISVKGRKTYEDYYSPMAVQGKVLEVIDICHKS